MTRSEFYGQVVALVAKGMSQQEAYEQVEKAYIKKHKQRRYVCYDSFYMVNYRAIVRDMTQGKIERDKIAKINKLCDEFKNGQLSKEGIIEEIKKYIL